MVRQLRLASATGTFGGIPHCFTNPVSDGVAFARTWRFSEVFHPRKSDVTGWREHGRCLGIRNSGRNRKLGLSLGGKGRPDDLNGRERHKISAVGRDLILIAACPSAIAGTIRPQSTQK